MNLSILNQIKNDIEHRYVTGLNVSSYELSGIICDVVAPTYIADFTSIDNLEVKTISPTLAKNIGVSSIPFNMLIKLADLDMKKIKKSLLEIKRKELTFVSVGYGGLSMNVLHFLSLLSYRSGVEQAFKELHVFENDNIDYSNILRFYKDMYEFQGVQGKSVKKTDVFNELNLASKTILHRYRLDSKRIEKYFDAEDLNPIYFGAPDYETRMSVLKDRNFLFAGHSGDMTTLIKSPIIESDLASETYGTINLTSFFINMLKITEATLNSIAGDIDSIPEDEVIFTWNAKENIISRSQKIKDVGKGIASYSLNDTDIKIMI